MLSVFPAARDNRPGTKPWAQGERPRECYAGQDALQHVPGSPLNPACRNVISEAKPWQTEKKRQVSRSRAGGVWHPSASAKASGAPQQAAPAHTLWTGDTLMQEYAGCVLLAVGLTDVGHEPPSAERNSYYIMCTQPQVPLCSRAKFETAKNACCQLRRPPRRSAENLNYFC